VSHHLHHITYVRTGENKVIELQHGIEKEIELTKSEASLSPRDVIKDVFG
jgi:hypothetical protein